MRRLELATDGTELCIRFPYDEALLPVVRGLPRRRFDREVKAWFCPRDEVVAAVDALKDLRFHITEEVLNLYRESGGTAAVGGAPSAPPGPTGGPTLWSAPAARSPRPAAEPDPDSLTVSQLNARVRQALRRAFPEEVWLVGEVTGYDRNQHRSHVWFELAEKEGGAADSTAKAVVSAVLFQGTRARVEERIAQAQAPFELADGIQVRLKVRVELYEPRGAYQVVVEDIDPIHTLGQLAQDRAKVLAEVERLGLTGANRGLPWPRVPLRVGLVTSPGSDAYNDFVNELQRSGLAFQVTLVPARMQGRALEQELIRALDWFTARKDDFDVVTIVRGGGARTDLMWFDTLPLALTVARCPLKVLCGIGHHRDVSVVDLLAHPEKTPTAAAQALVDRVLRFEERLRGAARRLTQRVTATRREQRRRLWLAAQGLGRDVRRLVRERRRERARLAADLARRTRACLRRQGQRLRGDTRRFADRGQVGLVRAGARLGALRRRFRLPTLAPAWQRQHRHLDLLRARARGLHPERILQRGFAWLRDADGRTVRRAAQASPGQRLEARLADGTLEARVEEVRPVDDPSSGPGT